MCYLLFLKPSLITKCYGIRFVEIDTSHLHYIKSHQKLYFNSYIINIDVVSEIKGIWCYVTMEYELYSCYTKPQLNKRNDIKFH